MTGRGIVREHEDVYYAGEKVGHTTSGTFCPYLNAAVAMALVEKRVSETGTALSVTVRGKEVPVEVIPLPFYKREK